MSYEIDMLGYTFVQDDACKRVKIYRDGRQIATATTNGPLDEKGLFDIVALLTARERGEI